jgi:hypothetical protein
VDISLKIAKIMSNAMNWKIAFTSLKGSKYSVTFPVSSDSSKYENALNDS